MDELIKQQKIEEIMLTIPQKIVAYNGDPKGQHLYGEQRLQIAEVLYNAGYRKIPENAIVLTNKEYNTLLDNITVLQKHFNNVKEDCILYRNKSRSLEQILIQIQEEKKNAIKEFAEKLKEKFDGYDATSYNGYEEGFHNLQEEINELLKEYE